jgi:hypothetical protein
MDAPMPWDARRYVEVEAMIFGIGMEHGDWTVGVAPKSIHWMWTPRVRASAGMRATLPIRLDISLPSGEPLASALTTWPEQR